MCILKIADKAGKGSRKKSYFSLVVRTLPPTPPPLSGRSTFINAIQRLLQLGGPKNALRGGKKITLGKSQECSLWVT